MCSQQKKIFLNELGYLCLIALLVLIFFYEMLFASKIPLFRDLGPYFYPLRFSLAQSFERGELPLWEPRLAMGFPLLADFQSGAFYLPNLVFLALPFITAIKAIFLLHVMIAAIGAYYLLRHWEFAHSIALIGSLLFTFSGLPVSLINVLNHFQAAVWLPWLLLLGEKQLVSPDRSKILFLVLLATLQFLAGSPEVYAMSMALFFLDGLRMIWEGKISCLRLFSSLLLVNVLVAGLAMVQILPTWELLHETPRYWAPSFQSASDLSLHPGSLLNLVFLDKEVDVTSFYRFQTFFTNPTRFFISLYMGALFPFGLWAWVLTEDKKKKAVLLAGVSLSLLLSMGSYTPVYRLFYDYFPLVFLSRFPEKFFFITFVFLLYVTLRGLAVLFLGPREPGLFGILIGPAVLFGIFFGLYLFFRSSRESLLQLIGFLKGISPDLPLTREISLGILLHLERQIALLLALGVLYFLWRRGRVQKSLMQILMVAITFFDLYSAHKSYLFLTDENVLRQKPPAINLLKEFPDYRVFFISPQSPIHPVIALFPKAKSPADQSTFSFFSLRPNTGILWGIHYMQDMDPLMKESYDDFRKVAGNLSADDLYRLLGNLNVKYLISLQELRSDGITQIGSFPEYPSWVYRIDRVTPRVYVVPTAIYEKEPRKVIGRLAGGEFSPSRQVILDEPMQLKPGKDFIGEAKVLSYADSKIRLDVSLNQKGVLVLADSYDPGWKVYVDGIEDKILRANYFFRGVALQPGEHQVEFRYQPRSLTLGLYISVIFLAAVSIWLISLFIRKI